MATWQTLVEFTHSSFRVLHADDSKIAFEFEFHRGRSQHVTVWRQLLGGAEWGLIESAFARVDSVDLAEVLTAAAEGGCGGVVAIGGDLAVRHAVPLAELDANEFVVPLRLVTAIADELEERFVGTDTR